MTTEQTKILNKIRALFAKTVDNGCTESEAMAALDKARAMMDAYEVTEADLQLTKEESAILKTASVGRDAHSIKAYLAMAVAEFSSCKAWKNREGGIVFCGMPVDAEMATWLLDTLSNFVLSELTVHLMGNIAPQGQRRLAINGFVGGCTRRIAERLRELCRRSEQTVSGNGRALVVVKSAAIADAMKAAGINVGKSRWSSRRVDHNSYNAGMSAGNRATFGRPVGAGSTRLLG